MDTILQDIGFAVEGVGYAGLGVLVLFAILLCVMAWEARKPSVTDRTEQLLREGEYPAADRIVAESLFRQPYPRSSRELRFCRELNRLTANKVWLLEQAAEGLGDEVRRQAREAADAVEAQRMLLRTLEKNPDDCERAELLEAWSSANQTLLARRSSILVEIKAIERSRSKKVPESGESHSGSSVR